MRLNPSNIIQCLLCVLLSCSFVVIVGCAHSGRNKPPDLSAIDAAILRLQKSHTDVDQASALKSFRVEILKGYPDFCWQCTFCFDESGRLLLPSEPFDQTAYLLFQDGKKGRFFLPFLVHLEGPISRSTISLEFRRHGGGP